MNQNYCGTGREKELGPDDLIDFLLQDFLTTNDEELCVSVGEILQVETEINIIGTDQG